mmetsp:Transcript_56105/g.156319  ORF Transcript_56105/g.156319 Transcript_56105/m.156319 type:complete len:154 (+) Transcript_56105:532-993(+)
MAHRKAGKARLVSAQSTSRTSRNMCAPTRIRTGASAHLGIADMIGAKRKAVRSAYTPITTDIRPVRPPSRTPAEALMLTNKGDEPRQAESMVATPQTMYIRRLPGASPFCSRPAILAEPMTPPLMLSSTIKVKDTTCSHTRALANTPQSGKTP